MEDKLINIPNNQLQVTRIVTKTKTMTTNSPSQIIGLLHLVVDLTLEELLLVHSQVSSQLDAQLDLHPLALSEPLKQRLGVAVLTLALLHQYFTIFAGHTETERDETEINTKNR